MSDTEHPEPCPLAPWPFVHVRWHDSCADHEWCIEEDAPGTVEIITRGWLIKTTRREIKVSASYYRVRGKWFFGETVAIPRTAVIKQEEVEG